MRDNINDVPCVFLGFTKEEEDMIRKSIGDSVQTGMQLTTAWENIADCFKRDNITFCLFVVSKGLEFVHA